MSFHERILRPAAILTFVLGVAACSSTPDAIALTESELGLALTSTALPEGAAFAVENTCADVNESPPFEWAPGPRGTKSYAMVMTDQSINLIHWILFDIAPSTTSLPANVEKAYQPANVPGARQTKSYSSSVRGYLGPCPPETHTYEFALFALDVETLPNVDETTTRAAALEVIAKHKLAVATLTGTYTPP